MNPWLRDFTRRRRPTRAMVREYLDSFERLGRMHPKALLFTMENQRSRLEQARKDYVVDSRYMLSVDVYLLAQNMAVYLFARKLLRSEYGKFHVPRTFAQREQGAV